MGDFNFLVDGQAVNHNWSNDASLSGMSCCIVRTSLRKLEHAVSLFAFVESVAILGKLSAILSQKKLRPVSSAMERV